MNAIFPGVGHHRKRLSLWTATRAFKPDPLKPRQAHSDPTVFLAASAHARSELSGHALVALPPPCQRGTRLTWSASIFLTTAIESSPTTSPNTTWRPSCQPSIAIVSVSALHSHRLRCLLMRDAACRRGESHGAVVHEQVRTWCGMCPEKAMHQQTSETLCSGCL